MQRIKNYTIHSSFISCFRKMLISAKCSQILASFTSGYSLKLILNGSATKKQEFQAQSVHLHLQLPSLGLRPPTLNYKRDLHSLNMVGYRQYYLLVVPCHLWCPHTQWIESVGRGQCYFWQFLVLSVGYW